MQGVNKGNERRAKFRFPIEREIRYKLAEDGIVVAAGAGKTLNISSGGVAFTTEQALKPGGFVEVSISWPVLLDETCPMRLVIFGRVLRCSGLRSVSTIDKYEFRTQARIVPPTPSAARTDTMLQRWVDGVRKDGVKAASMRA